VPWEELSFLFNSYGGYPGIELIGDRVPSLEELDHLVESGAFSMILEKPRERFILTPSRTDNRSRSPR